MTALAIGIESFPAEEKKAAKNKKAALKREIEAMSAAMVREEGLLNHPQGALLLEVSTRRVSELVELGKLTRFDFLGRTYVSMKEVRARREEDLKAGRPRRRFVENVKVSLQAALKTDGAQAQLGGFAGPYEKAKRQKRRSK